MQKADIDAMYRANGLGERCEEGSYIRMCVAPNGIPPEEHDGLDRSHYLISLGQAELLRDTLNAILPDDRHTFVVQDARITHAIEIVGGEDLFPGASIQDELDVPLGGLRPDNSFRDLPARPSSLLGDNT